MVVLSILSISCLKNKKKALPFGKGLTLFIVIAVFFVSFYYLRVHAGLKFVQSNDLFLNISKDSLIIHSHMINRNFFRLIFL